MGPKWLTTLNPHMGFWWDHSGSELGPIYVSFVIPLDKVNVLICKIIFQTTPTLTLNFSFFGTCTLPDLLILY